VVVDAEHGKFLGVHMIGPDVTERPPELVLASSGTSLPTRSATPSHAHPTLSEAVEGSVGHMINF